MVIFLFYSAHLSLLVLFGVRIHNTPILRKFSSQLTLLRASVRYMLSDKKVKVEHFTNERTHKLGVAKKSMPSGICR